MTADLSVLLQQLKDEFDGHPGHVRIRVDEYVALAEVAQAAVVYHDDCTAAKRILLWESLIQLRRVLAGEEYPS